MPKIKSSSKLVNSKFSIGSIFVQEESKNDEHEGDLVANLEQLVNELDDISAQGSPF